MTTTNDTNTNTTNNTTTAKDKAKLVYLKELKNKVKKKMTKRINSNEEMKPAIISSGISKHILHKKHESDESKTTTNTINEGNNNNTGHDATTNDEDSFSRDDNNSCIHDDGTTTPPNSLPSSPAHKNKKQGRGSFFVNNSNNDQYNNLSRRMELTNNKRQTDNKNTSSKVILSPSSITPKVSFSDEMTAKDPPLTTTTTPSSDTLFMRLFLLLLSDISIITASLCLLLYVTYLHREDIVSNGCLPCAISMIWIMYAFFIGFYISSRRKVERETVANENDEMVKAQKQREVEETTKQFRSSLITFNKVKETQHSDDDDDDRSDDDDDTRQSQSHGNSSTDDNHDNHHHHSHFIISSLTPTYLKNLLKSRKRKRPSSPIGTQQQQRPHYWRVRIPKKQRHQNKWEESLCDPVDDTLVNRLLSIKGISSSSSQELQRLSIDDGNDDDSNDDELLAPPTIKTSIMVAPLGHEKNILSQSKVDTLINEVVEPMCKLRGMDILKSDDPVENLCTNRELIRCGLRDVPTFIINVMTPSYNLVAYFQLPSWFSSFRHDLMEHPNDSNHVKMFKRFLNGTNTYRRNTFKILPCVPVAPLPLRLLSPSKQEYTIHGPTLPITIRQYEDGDIVETVVEEGGEEKQQEERGGMKDGSGMVDGSHSSSSSSATAALISFDIDCMTHPAVRKLSTLVLRHLNKCVLDMAFVIHDDDDDDDLACCVGLVRLDHVDVKDGVVLSGPTEREDVMMATEWKRSVVGDDGGVGEE